MGGGKEGPGMFSKYIEKNVLGNYNINTISFL